MLFAYFITYEIVKCVLAESLAFSIPLQPERNLYINALIILWELFHLTIGSLLFLAYFYWRRVYVSASFLFKVEACKILIYIVVYFAH